MSSTNKTPSSELRHTRARESSLTFRKYLLGLSSGAVAAFYIANTTKIDPPLTNLQEVFSLIATVLFSASLLFGLAYFRSDGKRYYWWGRADTAENKDDQSKFHRFKRQWKRYCRLCGAAQIWLFVVGLVSATTYTVFRILES